MGGENSKYEELNIGGRYEDPELGLSKMNQQDALKYVVIAQSTYYNTSCNILHETKNPLFEKFWNKEQIYGLTSEDH